MHTIMNPFNIMMVMCSIKNLYLVSAITLDLIRNLPYYSYTNSAVDAAYYNKVICSLKQA